jgi:hypothetical protein
MCGTVDVILAGLIGDVGSMDVKLYVFRADT